MPNRRDRQRVQQLNIAYCIQIIRCHFQTKTIAGDEGIAI